MHYTRARSGEGVQILEFYQNFNSSARILCEQPFLRHYCYCHSGGNISEIMVMFGYAISSFDVSDLFVHVPVSHYLTLDVKDPVVIHDSFDEDGWVWATTWKKGVWDSGWMPRAYWKEGSPSQSRFVDILKPHVVEQVYQCLRDVKHLACTCKRLHSCGVKYLDAVVTRATFRFPSLRDDIQLYGMPTYLHPLPAWHRWRVRVYVVIPSEGSSWSWYCNGSMLWESHWIRDLRDLPNLYARIGHTEGDYVRMSLCLEEWRWDYVAGTWQLVDYL